MTSAALLIIGGSLMMLQPLLSGPVRSSARYVGAALREAFVPAPRIPRSLRSLLEQMP